MPEPVNRGSAYLREIAETQGREPTMEEQNEAVRMVREDAGLTHLDKDLEGTMGDPYQRGPGKTSEWGRSVIAASSQPGDYEVSITPDGEGVDLPTVTSNEVPDIPTLRAQPPKVSNLYASMAAQRDAILKGNTDSFEEDAYAYREGVETVEDELISVLEERYNNDFVDQGVLNNLEGMSDEEKIQRITSEYMRSNANKEHVRNLLALNLIRQGYGDMPVARLDQMRRELTTGQVNALYQQYASQQRRELEIIIDQLAAQAGEGFTVGAALGEIVKQDIAPFYGAITRVLGTNKFLPEDVELGVLRRGLPGEVRQEIREWWVDASHEERKQYLEDLKRTWDDVRKGPNSGFYTRYLVIENLLGTFTEDLLYSEDPTDSLDRVFGNLDTAIGFVIAGGLFVKRGKSIFGMFSANKENLARQLAAAGGSRRAQETLDASIREMASELGMQTDEVGVPNLVPPKQMHEELGTPIEPDTVKHTTQPVSPNDLRRSRIMDYTDTADGAILTEADRASAARRVLDELDANDTIHVHHKMSSVRGLPNNTGIEYTITVGSRGGEGWVSVTDLIDDMIEYNPNIPFKLMRRNAEGVLEELPVSLTEIAEFKATGRIPYGLKDYIDLSPEAKEFDRFFGGRPISRVSMEELSGALDNGWVPADSPMFDFIREEIRLRNAKGVDNLGHDPLFTLDGDELFVQFEKTHFFDANDIQSLDVHRWYENLRKTDVNQKTGLISRIFPPNAKFDRLYEAAAQTYRMEEAALQELNDILRPFHKLNAKGKQDVAGIIEFVEDYSKDLHHTTGRGGVPDHARLRAEFPDVNDKTWEGYFALRDAMEGMYEVLNRRLYRDFTNRGAVTIRALGDDRAPNYHGVPIKPGELRSGKYLDPMRGELVETTAEEIDDLIAQGGTAIRLDFPIDAPSGGKTDVVLARPGDYQAGRLSNRVLNYYEGYHFRFYEDPYYVIKRTYDPEVNGRPAVAADGFERNPKTGRFYYDEAVATAPSRVSAERFLGRRHRDLGNGELKTASGEIFTIKASKQINNTEGTLYQKQALQREGRIFWDERAHRRLPDVHGNRAKISDPTYATEKGMALAMRQSTQEGMFKALKVGFENEYGDLPHFWNNRSKLKTDQLDELEKDLIKGRNEASGDTRKRYNKAIDIIRYMRTQMGTDSALIPSLRAWTINASAYVERVLDRFGATGRVTERTLGGMQKWGLELDVFSRLRKIAYGAFMVLRPARQALLQSTQVSMLTGLSPGYILSGKIHLDAFALRRGLSRYRWAGFDDGWSDASLAKAMGYTKKEYKRMVEEFQRSGLLGSVNTHHFGTTGGLTKQLDPDAGAWGRFRYDVRARGRSLYNSMGKIGFEFGEKNNLTYSWLVALRRTKKKKGIKDITQFSRTDWDDVAKEADALALAMTRPNKMAYQSGAYGTILQFLSFQHKALMTMTGANPALSRLDTFKVVMGMYGLWGFNILGAEDYIREKAALMGWTPYLSKEILPGITLGDALIGGAVESGFNALASAMIDDYKDLNIGILAPGAAVIEIYKQMLEVLSEAPIEGTAWMGPSGTQVSALGKAMRFMVGEWNNPTTSPAEKFMSVSKAFLTDALPQFNDVNQAIIAIQLQEWADKDGDKQGMQPVINTLLARGILGVRSEEEMSQYRLRSIAWDDAKNLDNWVDAWKPYMKAIVVKWRNSGEYSDDKAFEMAAVALNLAEGMPEGLRREAYRRIMTEPDTDGVSVAQLLAESVPNSNLKAMIPHIQNQTDIPPNERQMMVDFINEMADGYQNLDEAHHEMIQQDLNQKGIE